MARFKEALLREVEERDPENPITVYNPKNTQSVSLYFRGEKVAKVSFRSFLPVIHSTSQCPLSQQATLALVRWCSTPCPLPPQLTAPTSPFTPQVIGNAASTKPEEGNAVSGLLVKRNFNYLLVASEDLPEFTDLQTTVVKQRQAVRYEYSLSLLYHFMLQVHGADTVTLTRNDEEQGAQKIQVRASVASWTVPVAVSGVQARCAARLMSGKRHVQRVPRGWPMAIDATVFCLAIHIRLVAAQIRGIVDVSVDEKKQEVVLEWEASPESDMWADAAMAVVLQVDGSPAAIKRTFQQACGQQPLENAWYLTSIRSRWNSFSPRLVDSGPTAVVGSTGCSHKHSAPADEPPTVISDELFTTEYVNAAAWCGSAGSAQPCHRWIAGDRDLTASARPSRVMEQLSGQFGSCVKSDDGAHLLVTVDTVAATVNLPSLVSVRPCLGDTRARSLPACRPSVRWDSMVVRLAHGR